MAYHEFTYPQVLADLELTLAEADLHSSVPPLAPRPEFVTSLHEGAALARAIGTEKARSEFIIAPILMEVRLMLGKRFALFSGVELRADPKAGLAGVCDFLLARDPIQSVLRAPLIAVIEAKNENLRTGLGQCIASVVGARLVNEREGHPGPIHGVVTTGTAWQFLRLDGQTVTLDTEEYSLDRLDRLLGIFRAIIEGA